MRAQNWTPNLDGNGADRLLQMRFADELPGLLRLARRLTRDEQDAEDAVQDAIERAWRARGQLRDLGAVGGWLRRIVARSVADAHRRQADVPVGLAGELDVLPDVADPADVIAAADDERILRAALRELRANDQIAIVLHDGAGWTADEVGHLLGVTTEAAYKRIQRARVRLVSVLARPHGPLRRPSAGCRDARIHVDQFLEGTLEPSVRATVQEHLDHCTCCPAALQAAAGVLAALRADGGGSPVPDGLRIRLEELVHEASEAP